jgi:hypothetical protein
LPPEGSFVNPNGISEYPDFSPNSSTADDGASYLRRLKADKADTAPATPVSSPNTKANGGDWKERRRSPRIRCSGSAEFVADGSDVRLWGTITDISQHGCYVEMSNTFPIGTKVHLVLKSYGIRILVSGEVRTSYPALGMGILFAELVPQEAKELGRLLAALSGSNAFASTPPAQENLLDDPSQPADPRALLKEVTEFFRKESLLSRDQFHEIAKRIRRP